MTREEALRHSLIIFAYAIGKDIEMKSITTDEWVLLPNPEFNRGVDNYRIAEDKHGDDA